MVQKYERENCRNKQFIHFKLHAIMSHVIQSRAGLLPPTRDMNHLSGHQTNCHSVTVPVSKSPLSYSLRAPKHRSSDPSSSNTPKRSGEVLPLSMTYRNKQYVQGRHCLHFHASTGGPELYPQQIRGDYGVMMFIMIKAPV